MRDDRIRLLPLSVCRRISGRDIDGLTRGRGKQFYCNREKRSQLNDSVLDAGTIWFFKGWLASKRMKELFS